MRRQHGHERSGHHGCTGWPSGVGRRRWCISASASLDCRVGPICQPGGKLVFCRNVLPPWRSSHFIKLVERYLRAYAIRQNNLPPCNCFFFYPLTAISALSFRHSLARFSSTPNLLAAPLLLLSLVHNMSHS